MKHFISSIEHTPGPWCIKFALLPTDYHNINEAMAISIFDSVRYKWYNAKQYRSRTLELYPLYVLHQPINSP